MSYLDICNYLVPVPNQRFPGTILLQTPDTGQYLDILYICPGTLIWIIQS